ncbi:Transposable element Tcb2 transposase [Trichostrongylus colubriformis]|uniref:Transposable element Tcb2 transposase n=1 Tax=Trichostrongylus colubriformis TaxID=6319 RepID=A0AAN8FSX2_TRICO
MIRDVNKLARVDFCSEMLAANVGFSDCVFTDECTVQIDCSTKFCFVKKGDQYSRMRNRAKHPAKVHIWGGISVRGATRLAILPGNCRIDSELYCRIIERCYIPFKSKVYNGFCRLVQDNAPPHKSRYTSDKFKNWGVDTLAWPAESPDLNPIELIWGNMKKMIRKQGIGNLDALKVAIAQYWDTLTPEICSRYVAGIRKRMERVVEQEGRNITEDR